METRVPSEQDPIWPPGPERPPERGAGPERPPERGAGPERPPERGAGPAGPPGPAGPATGSTDDRLERRLSALEARLDDLDEAVREAVPAALRHAVQEELQGVSEDLRRAVSELGRLLLRDLDRLTKLLADHRDTIVERLSEPAEPAEPAGIPLEADAGEVQTPGEQEDEPTPLGGEDGRWRVLPIRKGGRRSHGRRPGGDTSPG
ncbi:MAG: hypothetical protein ABR540_15710 [Acidimicrobiales bacterium]